VNKGTKALFVLLSVVVQAREGGFMAQDTCKHEWTTINVKNGFLVTEGCSHCGARQALFTPDDRQLVDSYMVGPHKWRFLSSSQAVKFDLKCTKCGKETILDNMVGLMLCLECKDDCKAGALARHEAGENVWVYLALCGDTSHLVEGCVSEEGAKALTEYFNSKIKTPGKKIVIVPCSYRPSVDTCQGEVLADVGMKEL
jgi:hypothetical protein